MDSGYSLAERIPPGFSPDYQPFLFNRVAHRNLQQSGRKASLKDFFLLRKLNQKVMAEISFHVDGNLAMSPLRAPFGSFLFSDQLSPKNLYDFIIQCQTRLKKEGIAKILITDPPLYYRKSGEMLQTILFNLGYTVHLAELSAGIRIGHGPFENNIETWEKRKLKQAKEKGSQFKPVPVADLEKVYEFILRCRKERDQALSMTFEEVKQVVSSFPGEFFLFAIWIQKEMAAASISIRVHPDILYNFYSGHLQKFDPISPVVSLIAGMYKFCDTHQYHLLDLGTSAINGQPNFGLLDFKFRLGAVPSMKLTFEKEL